MTKKRKGVDELLGAGRGTQAPDTGRVERIRLEEVVADPEQPRKHFDQAKLVELGRSMDQQGLINPVLLERVAPGRYLLVAGERRWRAAQHAKHETIDAIVSAPTDPSRRLERALAENIQREDLHPLEEARALARYQQLRGLTQQELADRLGLERPTVANKLRLLRLEPEPRRLLEEGRLSAGHGKALAGLPAQQQDGLAKRAVKEQWTVRQLERAAAQSQPEAPVETPTGEATKGTDRAERQPPTRRQKGPVARLIASTQGSGVHVEHRPEERQLVLTYSKRADIEELIRSWLR